MLFSFEKADDDDNDDRGDWFCSFVEKEKEEERLKKPKAQQG